MNVFFIFSIIIFLFIIYTSTEMTGVCSNVSDRSLLKCCPNYRLVGSSCEECWSGTIGINCKDNCPPNYYGRLCLEKCGCQPCDRVKGCLNLTDNSSPANSALWITLSVLASCIVPCFIFCLRIFCILRQRMLTKKPSDLDEYGSKNEMAPIENSRYSISKTPRTIDSSQTYDTETSYGKCHTTVSNNMTETTSRNAYGCDDSMDGTYNILKLTVSDKNEHMLIPNNTSSPLEIQKHTKVHEDTSQMASSVSNIVKTKNHESKPLIHREKKKHQKELLRALDEFKQGSTKERKKLRYSFTKSTELF
ncbi:uncharacterized protein [Magallana gigas]|uniref:uncharacterized protein n=1 Tax=Magallana gigas TaxID=29159 RepID=UPI00333E1B18